MTKHAPLTTMTLKVSLFAGVGVVEASYELCLLADRIGVLCEADFNGVKLWARPGDDCHDLVESWHEQMKRPAGYYKVAQAKRA